MRQKSHSTDLSSEEIVKGIRRATRKRYSAEDKIRIVRGGSPMPSARRAEAHPDAVSATAADRLWH